MDRDQNPQCSTTFSVRKKKKMAIKENLLGNNASKVLITSDSKLSEVFSRVQSNLNVVHVHTQGIENNMGMLATFSSNNIDAILISETWLTPNACSENINLPGYTLIRNDWREDCGGLAIYLRESIRYKIIHESSNKYAMAAEHLLVEISYQETKVLLFMFYSPSSKLNYFPHFDLLLRRYRLKYDHIICLGDFKTDLLITNKRSSKFLDVIDEQNLFILPEAPTRVRPNIDPTVTDLMLVSSPDNVAKSGQLGGYYPSHDILYLSYRL